MGCKSVLVGIPCSLRYVRINSIHCCPVCPAANFHGYQRGMFCRKTAAGSVKAPIPGDGLYAVLAFLACQHRAVEIANTLKPSSSPLAFKEGACSI